MSPTTPAKPPVEEVSGTFQAPQEDNVTLKFSQKTLLTTIVALVSVLGIGGTGAFLNATKNPTDNVESAVAIDIKEMKESLKLLPTIQAQLTQMQNDKVRSDKIDDDHEARLRSLESRVTRPSRVVGE